MMLGKHTLTQSYPLLVRAYDSLGKNAFFYNDTSFFNNNTAFFNNTFLHDKAFVKHRFVME